MNLEPHRVSRRKFIGSAAATLAALASAPGATPASASPRLMAAAKDPGTGQYLITEGGAPVLRYNYATLEPGALLESVSAANRIYARARSDYIHPLYGLDGQELTQDWSKDHPHHRGIYWAWPEVDWRGQRGDLHALQRVFARPAGRCVASAGEDYAQIEADNVWKWENKDPIVRETARIRACRATAQGRVVDLEFRFTAIAESVWIARRGTDKYGGLNVRLAPVKDQLITWQNDPPAAGPRMAWGEISGVFPGGQDAAGLVTLQHPQNPDYPGDWIQYPELNWLQPVFPASGTRFELKKDLTLTLRFRLWIHRGPAAGAARCREQWRLYTQSAKQP